MVKDLTVGKPFKVLLGFTVPMLFSLFFQQLYSMVDSIVAGRGVGVDALAAIGASFPITMLFIAIGTGASIGCSVVISQFFGARRYKEVKTAVWTSVIFFSAVAAVLTIIGIFICRPLLALMQTPENIFNDAAAYLDIYIYGIFFLFIYNVSTAVFNALGDSKTPLIFLAFSSLLNVALDIWFVVSFKWGVVGLALATFAAQGISCVLSMATLMARLKKITVDGGYSKFNLKMLKKILMISIPSILQQSFISVGQLFVQGLVNSFGSVTIAGYSAALKINTFAVMSFNTISGALSSFVAQNFGAQKLDRIKQGLKAALIIAMSLCLIIVAAAFLFSEQLIGFFSNGESSGEFIKVGQQFLLIVFPFHFAVAFKILCDGVLRGSGFMRGFMASTFTDLLLRVIFSFVFAPMLGFGAICWAYPFGWVLSLLITVYYYFSGKWKNVKALTEN